MLLSRFWYGLWICLLALPALAQTAPPGSAPLDVAAVDAVVARALQAFDVPGMAVAVVMANLPSRAHWPSSTLRMTANEISSR